MKGIRTLKNGAVVLSEETFDSDSSVVLAWNGRDYVTWRCFDGTDCYWGHYFSDLAMAKSDFWERIGRATS